MVSVGRFTILLIAAALWAGSAEATSCEGMKGGPGDLDGDGFVQAADCDDTDPGTWLSPDPVRNLRFEIVPDTFVWDAPADPGSTSPLVYDVFRSTSAVLTSVDCFDPAVEVLSETDFQQPLPGVVFHYLVVPKHGCGSGGAGPGRPMLSCDCSSFCDDGDACTAETCSSGGCFNPLIAPEILVPPNSVASCVGGVADLTVAVVGAGSLTYQWYRNGAPVGTNNPILTLVGLGAAADGSQITVEVTDGCSSAMSAAATLTVFDDSVSCLGGNDGQEAPNGASHLFDEDPFDMHDRVNSIVGSSPGLALAKNAGGAHPHSGEYYLVETDLHIPGRGFDFSWRREYRSREALSSAQGVQWDHAYNRKIEVDPIDSANLLVHDGSARIDIYEPDGTGCWMSPGFFRELCELAADGSFELTFANKHRWVFAPHDGSATEGKIVSSTDRNGNSMSFAYDAAGRLTTINDTLGRSITVSYNPQNLISGVTDYIGRSVVYEYYSVGEFGGEAGDLKSRTTPAVVNTPTGNDFPQGKTTVYTYTRGFNQAELNHNLLTITDPLGNTFLTNVYTPTSFPADARFDRLNSQITLSGTAAFVYVPQTPGASNNFAVTKTIVNDRAGKVHEYFYDDLNRLVIKRDYTGLSPNPIRPTDDFSNLPVGPFRPADPAFFETSYEYNSDFLPTRMVLLEGNEAQMLYDSMNANRRLQGNLLSRTQLPGAAGGDQTEIVETWEYITDFGTTYDFPSEPGFQESAAGLVESPTTYVDPRGFNHVFSYDTNGNLETLTEPTVTIGQPAGGSQEVLHAWLHNSFGQITQYTNPAGRVDQYAYYNTGPQTGYLQKAIVDEPGSALTTSFAYDDVGNLLSVTDPRANTTNIIVNELNQLVCVTASAPFLYNTYFYYDADNRLIRTDVQNVDDQGVLQPNPYLSADHLYDALDRLIRSRNEVDEDTCVIGELEWDGNDNPTLFKSGEAVNGNQPTNVVRALYDERDLPFQIIRAEGDSNVSTTQFDYDGNGNLTAIRAGLEDAVDDHVTLMTYDGYDRPVTVTDALVNVSTMHYDANSNPTSTRVDGDGGGGGAGGSIRLHAVDYTYDEVDRLVQSDVHFFDPATQTAIGDGFSTSKWRWDEDGRFSSLEDDNGNVTGCQYDSVRRKSLITDGKGNTRMFGYDANSNMIGMTDTDVSDTGAISEVFTYVTEYDELNRSTAMNDPLMNRWEVLYDSRGNRTRSFDSLNNETRYVYDGLNRPVRTEQDLTGTGMGGGSVIDTLVTSQTWDDSSRLTGRTDDNGNTTSYGYDALNRLTDTMHADGTLSQLAYDLHDRPLTAMDANGTVQANIFDALDRLESRTISRAMGVLGTTAESYGYDGLSRLVLAADDDSTVTLRYDSLSNVVEETLQIAAGPQRSVFSTHDGVGNKLVTTYPSGRDVATTYDALDRVDVISSGAIATVVDYGYIGNRVETATRPAVETTYGYDGARRVTRMTHTKNPALGPQIIVDTAFDWDERNHLASHTDQLAGGDDRSFGYDSAGRMIRAAIAGPSPQTVDYVLDGVGNRSLVSDGPDAGAYTLDPALPDPADFQVNQYSTTPLDTRQYDSNGNCAVRDPGLATERIFSYDYRNMLVGINISGGTDWSYSYDALGRRIAKVDGASGDATRFYYDGGRVVEEQDAANLARMSYLGGTSPDDGVIFIAEEADVNGNGAMDNYWYHGDHNGNVLALTNASGDIVESYRYGDYGAPEFFDTSGGAVAGTTIGNPYLFAGRRFDQETGYYYNRTRYLDPHAGRFTTRDSIGTWGDPQSLGNGYTYAAGNPWTHSDPSGQSAEKGRAEERFYRTGGVNYDMGVINQGFDKMLRSSFETNNQKMTQRSSTLINILKTLSEMNKGMIGNMRDGSSNVDPTALTFFMMKEAINRQEVGGKVRDPGMSGSSPHGNVNELVFSVIRESLNEQNEDKKYWAAKLAMFNAMGKALAGYLDELGGSGGPSRTFKFFDLPDPHEPRHRTFKFFDSPSRFMTQYYTGAGMSGQPLRVWQHWRWTQALRLAPALWCEGPGRWQRGCKLP